MENNVTLFGESEAPSRKRKGPQGTKWLLATNQRNLLYMLAAGMLMPPEGFDGKYYQDPLACFPGWITLFADRVPQGAIELSVREKLHLTPCIATVDLGAMKGRIVGINGEGRRRELIFPEETSGAEAALLVPAPLPVTWIKTIVFPSQKDKGACEADARDFANVPLSDFKREVKAAPFAKPSKLPWPPGEIALPARDCELEKPLAAGGIMALLLHLGNRGELAMHACRSGFDGEERDGRILDPMLGDPGAWMRGDAPGAAATDVLPGLYWGAVEAVMKCRFNTEGKGPGEAILDYLDAAGKGLEEKARLALAKLAMDLRKLTGLGNSTITELFERHPRAFSRALTLFFLRDNSADLIAFRHPLLTERDYVAAAILFAARDGWLGLPLSLREIPGLPAAACHRMAAMAHRRSGSGLDLGTPPPRPRPLRELFVPESGGWTARQREAALTLARQAKWGDCIQTRIELGKGEYRLEIEGGGARILIPGDVRAVVAEIDPARFLGRLGDAAIGAAVEKKLRRLLGDAP